MNALFFDYAERRITDSTVILSFRQRTNDEEDVLTVRGFGLPLNAVYVGFYNRKAEFELYQIVDVNENKVTHELTLFCESDMYELVGEKTINDARPTKTTAGLALAQALDGTRFEVGIVDDTSISSTRFFYCSPFAAVRKIETAWPVRARPRYVVSGARIEHRYIDLLSNAPIWRGKRFEIGKDILSASLREDRRNVVTALTGRGKGESVGDGYGRRIDFSNVVWSKANGDPVDKPLGQDWIEDPAATALYGICGTRPRFSVVEFDDIEDDNELILATWNALQAASAPTLSGELSAVALETLGFPHEAAYYGDEIAFISDNRRLRARIVSIEREFAYDGADVFQFGKLSDSTARQMAAVKRDIVTTKDKASAGALIAQKNEGLLSGYLDTMKTQILSTGTKFYTDKYDGGFVFESADGSSAVKLTGSGILIAPTRSADAWNWTLAIDGSGIVADTITSGVINAAVIKIFGTNSFYWDAANINIINPTNTNHQIRIGRFDGTNYGIGFTTDGGETWASAIGFNGVVLSAGAVTKETLSADVSGQLDSYAESISSYNSQLSLMDKKIAAKVSQTDYVADMSGKANAADVEAQFNAAAELTAKNLALKFTESKTYTDEKTANFDAFAEEMMTYFEFAVTGLLIGMKDSPFKAQISNEKLSFTQNGEEVAFIQYNRMHITEARVTDRLSIGTEDNGYFDWVTTNDGFGLKWR